jgi:hypothetical protein
VSPETATALFVSELHIPGYAQSKLAFILQDDDLLVEEDSEINSSSTISNSNSNEIYAYSDTLRAAATTATLSSLPFTSIVAAAPTKRKIQQRTYTAADSISLIPHEDGHLIHHTRQPVFTSEECQRIVEEAELVASKIAWTTNRHGNFPTTDLPLIELPKTLKFLRLALVERIYPLLSTQFGFVLPDATKLRLADGFVVKYDANGGQTQLKPHRDGSVLSFNIALNPAQDFEGGGTWFSSLEENDMQGGANEYDDESFWRQELRRHSDSAAVRIDQGEMVSHASALLHGGHGITTGNRYILVGFVILEGYDSWSMRFYNQVRNK